MGATQGDRVSLSNTAIPWLASKGCRVLFGQGVNTPVYVPGFTWENCHEALIVGASDGALTLLRLSGSMVAPAGPCKTSPSVVVDGCRSSSPSVRGSFDSDLTRGPTLLSLGSLSGSFGLMWSRRRTRFHGLWCLSNRDACCDLRQRCRIFAAGKIFRCRLHHCPRGQRLRGGRQSPPPLRRLRLPPAREGIAPTRWKGRLYPSLALQNRWP